QRSSFCCSSTQALDQASGRPSWVLPCARSSSRTARSPLPVSTSLSASSHVHSLSRSGGSSLLTPVLHRLDSPQASREGYGPPHTSYRFHSFSSPGSSHMSALIG